MRKWNKVVLDALYLQNDAQFRPETPNRAFDTYFCGDFISMKAFIEFVV
jgi:hypothetical protein